MIGTQRQIKLYIIFIVQVYQISQYVVPRGGIFFGKWRSSFAGNSDGKINVQSACALNKQALQHKSRNAQTKEDLGNDELKILCWNSWIHYITK
jgi:hypothetical protein